MAKHRRLAQRQHRHLAVTFPSFPECKIAAIFRALCSSLTATGEKHEDRQGDTQPISCSAAPDPQRHSGPKKISGHSVGIQKAAARIQEGEKQNRAYSGTRESPETANCVQAHRQHLPERDRSDRDLTSAIKSGRRGFPQSATASAWIRAGGALS